MKDSLSYYNFVQDSAGIFSFTVPYSFVPLKLEVLNYNSFICDLYIFDYYNRIFYISLKPDWVFDYRIYNAGSYVKYKIKEVTSDSFYILKEEYWLHYVREN